MPAYHAEKTIKKTVLDIPSGTVDTIIVVDDASRDNTVQVARELGLQVYTHEKNKGYGGNQKPATRKPWNKARISWSCCTRITSMTPR